MKHLYEKHLFLRFRPENAVMLPAGPIDSEVRAQNRQICKATTAPPVPTCIEISG